MPRSSVRLRQPQLRSDEVPGTALGCSASVLYRRAFLSSKRTGRVLVAGDAASASRTAERTPSAPTTRSKAVNPTGGTAHPLSSS